jgi:WhiB family transcriptional regulator, redox-sensing transcriptional regulator
MLVDTFYFVLDFGLEDVGWHQYAACRDVDPEIFYPGQGRSAQPAREVCAGCRVRSECLDYALNDGDARAWGVWGGTTPRLGAASSAPTGFAHHLPKGT